jgi:hypothetical protein
MAETPVQRGNSISLRANLALRARAAHSGLGGRARSE